MKIFQLIDHLCWLLILYPLWKTFHNSVALKQDTYSSRLERKIKEREKSDILLLIYF